MDKALDVLGRQSESARKIFNAIRNAERFGFIGLTEEELIEKTGLSIFEIETALDDLEYDELVGWEERSKGIIYFLTDEGSKVI